MYLLTRSSHKPTPIPYSIKILLFLLKAHVTMCKSLWIPLVHTKSNIAFSFSLVIFLILLFTMHPQQTQCSYKKFLKLSTFSNRFHSRWKYLKITVRTISTLFNCFIVIRDSRKTPLFEAFRITITTCRLINTKMIYSVVLVHCQGPPLLRNSLVNKIYNSTVSPVR